MYELLNEEGRVIARAVLPPTETKRRFLAPYDDAYPCLRYIDPYDDTVFTGVQMGAFLPDWRTLSLSAATQGEKQFAADVEALAERCEAPSPDLFLYLRYLGD